MPRPPPPDFSPAWNSPIRHNSAPLPQVTRKPPSACITIPRHLQDDGFSHLTCPHATDFPPVLRALNHFPPPPFLLSTLGFIHDQEAANSLTLIDWISAASFWPTSSIITTTVLPTQRDSTTILTSCISIHRTTSLRHLVIDRAPPGRKDCFWSNCCGFSAYEEINSTQHNTKV